MDEFVSHQVSKVHTAAFVKAMGIDSKKVLTIFGEHGNIGPASVPIVLSKLREMGRLKKGDRVALLGIGSGLNCSRSEEHTSELQSLMRISYAVFSLKKKKPRH